LSSIKSASVLPLNYALQQDRFERPTLAYVILGSPVRFLVQSPGNGPTHFGVMCYGGLGFMSSLTTRRTVRVLVGSRSRLPRACNPQSSLLQGESRPLLHVVVG
jgi:hypothetical protein